MSDPVLLNTLKGLAFLASATDAEVDRFATAARFVFFEAGAVIFRDGERLDHIFIVSEGIVAVEIFGPGQRPKRIQTVGVGELLGWSPLLGSSLMTATARAVTSVRLVAIDARLILAVCDEDPRFGYDCMRRVATAIAGRLHSTRLQLLDVYRTELPDTDGLGVSP
jgi:CRP/FNR family transcriptional regulator, cyclic AMP receptor protein